MIAVSMAWITIPVVLFTHLNKVVCRAGPHASALKFHGFYGSSHLRRPGRSIPLLGIVQLLKIFTDMIGRQVKQCCLSRLRQDITV